MGHHQDELKAMHERHALRSSSTYHDKEDAEILEHYSNSFDELLTSMEENVKSKVAKSTTYHKKSQRGRAQRSQKERAA